jgi:hypothetical protein
MNVSHDIWSAQVLNHVFDNEIGWNTKYVNNPIYVEIKTKKAKFMYKRFLQLIILYSFIIIAIKKHIGMMIYAGCSSIFKTFDPIR